MSLTLEKLHEDLAVLSANKVKALESIHQIIGAISIVEQMIDRIKLEAAIAEKQIDKNDLEIAS